MLTRLSGSEQWLYSIIMSVSRSDQTGDQAMVQPHIQPNVRNEARSLEPAPIAHAIKSPAIRFTDCLRQIYDDWQMHDRDWTRPGFRAVAVHRFGVWRMQIQPRWVRLPFSWFYKVLFRYVRNHYGIELPYSVKLGDRVIIEHQSGIVVHGNAEIGDDCILRQGVTIGLRRLTHKTDAPKLGKRVNVGAGAQILGAIMIGDDVRIGANAVVLCDVPAGATAIGIPAQVILPTHIAFPVPPTHLQINDLQSYGF
jgi:serine O-acetyltransferase